MCFVKFYPHTHIQNRLFRTCELACTVFKFVNLVELCPMCTAANLAAYLAPNYRGRHVHL